MKIFKTLVKATLRKFEKKLIYVRRNTVSGTDINEDLKILLPVEDPVIFDIGANSGQTIEIMRGLFKLPSIYSFEPSASSFSKLVGYESLPGVCIHNVGVGDKPGNLELNEYPSSDLSSFLKLSENKESRFRGGIPCSAAVVKVITIDDFLSDHHISHVNLLKTDTQGFDLNVLKGAGLSLEKKAIDIIMVELNFIELYQGQGKASEIIEFLASKDYGLVDLYQKERKGNCIQWCDAIFSVKP